MSKGQVGLNILSDLGKAAFRNPDGAAQVFTGLRKSLGQQQVDELKGALLQQAINAV